MSTTSYLAPNPEELFGQAPPEIQELIHGDDVNNVTAILGKAYKLPVSSYVALSNLVAFLLIGAIQPQDAVRAIKDILGLNEEDAYKLATDLDKTILEKARISILGKSPKDMVTLTFQEGRSPDELRKEILDTTSRTPVVTPAPAVAAPQTAGTTPPVRQNVVSGSRSQLMDQLRILDDIPNDEEISDRLKKIQEQIAGMNAKDERALESPIALQEFMSKNGKTGAVAPEIKSASYSRAPTKYNVDPYREVAEEN